MFFLLHLRSSFMTITVKLKLIARVTLFVSIAENSCSAKIGNTITFII